MVRRQDAAERAEAAADAARDDAASRKADLDRRTADASDRAAAVSSELGGVVADTDAAVVAQQREQKERNDTTAANWRAYLARLAAAGVERPPAETLRDPARLPAGLAPLPGRDGPQRGVAKFTDLLVLSRETVDAVGRAVDALGKPYVPGRGGSGPTAYSCDGLVRAAYGGPPGGATECDSYRMFGSQVRLYGVKPALAAIPGTSNHGWGLAVDLCGGIQSFGSSEYAWMTANAPRFGWSNPLWARPSNGREQPWHWEFSGR